MSMYSATYDAATTAFDVAGVKAGSPEEMEVAVASLFAGRGLLAADIVDVKLCGAEEGPEWECAVLFASTASFSVQASLSHVAAAIGGTPAEAYLNLRARLTAQHAQFNTLNINKVEIAGGGRGEKFMAIALASQSPG